VDQDRFTSEKERLLELQKQEIGLFERLREITKEQAEMLAADDAEAFDRSLDRSSEIIEKIEGLHQESEILMQSYTSNLPPAHAEKNDPVLIAANQIKDALSECARLHEINSAAAKAKADSYITGAGKLNVRRRSLGLYTQALTNSPTMFDRRS